MDVVSSLTRTLGRVVSPGAGTASKQLYFAALVVAFTAVTALSHGEYVRDPVYMAALVLLAGTTVLAVTVPWEERCTRWVAVVPLLDLGTVALLRDLIREHGTAVSLLSLIPALWLAGRLRLRGTIFATVGVTVLITVPSLLRAPHVDSLVVAHAALLPVTVLQIGLLATGALRLMDAQIARTTETLAERERLLEETAVWRRRLETILDSVDVGIVVVDREGRDMLMNRAQRRVHALATPPGHPDPDESALLVSIPGTGAPVPPAQRPVRRAVQQETFSNYVVTVGPPDDGGVQLATSARQIIDPRGERDGAVVLFSDVTAYVEAERLQQEFVAAVSHELRTPLTSVIGYLEMARDDLDLGRETSSYLEVAERNAQQLLTLVSDLLADQTTRASTGRLSPRPHRLSELADHSVRSLTPRAEQGGIVLEAELAEVPVQSVDGPRLTQAIDNLLTNAIKYTPRGGRVLVRTRVTASAVELSVADTGIGMSDAEQTELFTDRYRTETARRSAIPGHGIGLALTRRIVVAHGGQISVRSTPGAGSTFTIVLPWTPPPGVGDGL